MNDLSKDAVMREIMRQHQPPPQGLLGNMRDPVNMRSRQEYTRYVLQQQEQGMPAMPFEDWQRQYMQQPAAPAGPGMMERLRGLLGMLATASPPGGGP